jgi:hypothetical protein
MGFHIININNENNLEVLYADNIEELAKFSSITDESIIYQGERHWTANKIKDSKQYSAFGKDWHRAGILAQFLFKEQAEKEKLILEELKQDQSSFKSYTKVSSFSKKIKRGDFLIRNVRNLEIDVKCRGFKSRNGETYFHFNVEDLEKHMNMMSFTKTPIIIAVYERKENGLPCPNNLFMFNIEDIYKEKDKLRSYNVETSGKCYEIGLSHTVKGFDLVHSYKEEVEV